METITKTVVLVYRDGRRCPPSLPYRARARAMWGNTLLGVSLVLLVAKLSARRLLPPSFNIHQTAISILAHPTCQAIILPSPTSSTLSYTRFFYHPILYYLILPHIATTNRVLHRRVHRSTLHTICRMV